jgi:hypothetical protein
MSIDDRLHRAAAHLRAGVDEGSIDDRWRELQARCTADRSAAMRRQASRRRLMTGAAIGLAAACFAVVAVVVASDHDSPEVDQPVPSPTVVTSTTAPEAASTTAITTPTTTTTTPIVSAHGPLVAPSGRSLVDVSTPSADVAWAITADAEGTTSLVRRDATGGWTDVDVDAPSSDLRTVRFADDENGWVTTPDAVLSTHDAGASWHRWTWTGGGGPAALEAADGRVHVVGFGESGAGFAVYTSPVDRDDFVPSQLTIRPGAGPVAEFSMALQGSSGWLVYDDRLVSGGARLVDGTWVAWKPPCMEGSSTTSAGMPIAETHVAAPPSGTEVFALCTAAGPAPAPAVPAVFVSHDGGESFATTASLPDAAATFVGSQLFAVGDAVMVTYQRDDGTDALAVSDDDGESWRVAARSPEASIAWMATVDGPTGSVVQLAYDAPGPSGDLGLVSDDGLATWTPYPAG